MSSSSLPSSSSSPFLSEVSTWFAQIRHGFTSLKDSPKELYLIYILKFLDSYSYFSFSIIFTIYLSDEFQFNDIEAGTYYGLWGAFITIYGLLTGCVVDNIGVAKSLQLGMVTSCISRICIFVTTSRPILLWNVCFLLPIGNCLGIPVMTTAIRRYTHEHKNRGFAYGLFYVIMNVGAIVVGPVVDIITIYYDPAGRDDVGGGGGRRLVRELSTSTTASTTATSKWTLSGNRLIVLTGVIANVIAVVLSFMVREIKISDSTDTATTSDGTMDTTTTTTGGSGGYKDNADDEVDVVVGVADTSTEQPSYYQHQRTQGHGMASTTIAMDAPHGEEEQLQQPQSQPQHEEENFTTFTPLKGSPYTIVMETIQTQRFWVRTNCLV